MEMNDTVFESQTAQWLPDQTHPNYQLWTNYARFARDRGELVADILSSFGALESRNVLDIGCGQGGTALALADRGARVIALDTSLDRVAYFRQTTKRTGLNLTIEMGDARWLPFRKQTFDWVVMQDVLEHVPDPAKTVSELAAVLKPGGYVYLSTPNRWSPLNFISDPHWNLPLVSILPRRAVIFFIMKIVRREKVFRSDFAALLGLPKIRRLFECNNIRLQFVNSRVASELFVRPTAVVNSDFHLSLIRKLRKWRIEKFVRALVNDNFGVFNHVLNPTWYVVGRKTERLK